MGKTFSAFAALPIVRHYAVDDSSWSICACVFLLEVQYSILKSLISTCVLSYVGSREDWLLDRICESRKDCWDSIRRTSYPYQLVERQCHSSRGGDRVIICGDVLQ